MENNGIEECVCSDEQTTVWYVCLLLLSTILAVDSRLIFEILLGL